MEETPIWLLWSGGLLALALFVVQVVVVYLEVREAKRQNRAGQPAREPPSPELGELHELLTTTSTAVGELSGTLGRLEARVDELGPVGTSPAPKLVELHRLLRTTSKAQAEAVEELSSALGQLGERVDDLNRLHLGSSVEPSVLAELVERQDSLATASANQALGIAELASTMERIEAGVGGLLEAEKRKLRAKAVSAKKKKYKRFGLRPTVEVKIEEGPKETARQKAKRTRRRKQVGPQEPRVKGLGSHDTD